MSIKTQARSLMMRHHQSIMNREKSLLMRTAAEIGVDVDPKFHIQIRGATLNDFIDVYDRSRATMS